MQTKQTVEIRDINEPVSKMKLLSWVQSFCNLYTDYDNPEGSDIPAAVPTITIYAGRKRHTAVIVYKPYLANIELKYFLHFDKENAGTIREYGEKYYLQPNRIEKNLPWAPIQIPERHMLGLTHGVGTDYLFPTGYLAATYPDIVKVWMDVSTEDNNSDVYHVEVIE